MAASVENQKYNTEESVKELVGGLPKQRFNNLKAYLNTVRAYKTKLIQRPDETDLEYEIRKKKTKEEFPELHLALEKNLKEPQIIDLILKLEKQAIVGDFPDDVDYRLMASKQKEIGNFLLGVSSVGVRNNPKQHTPKIEKENVFKIFEMLNLQQKEPVMKQPQTQTQTQTQTETQTIGADPNTIVDKPKQMTDPVIVNILSKKVRELEKLKKSGKSISEEIKMMTEYQESLKSKLMTSPKNKKIIKELDRVSKLIESEKGEVSEINPELTSTQITPIKSQSMEVKMPPSKKSALDLLGGDLPEVKQPPQPQPQPQAQPQSPKKSAFSILNPQNNQSAPVVDVNLTNNPSDRNIGNVREIGLAPYDELAKADDVLVPKTERQKSLELFANFNWKGRGATNNSALADLSPFQKIQDYEDNLRYGKCFKIKAKIPIEDYYKPYMAKRCEKLFTEPQFTPNTKVLTLMQPSTPIGFAFSNEKNRNVLINEKEFDKKENLEFLPKYTDRPKKNNPFSACNGLESYYPNEMIMPPIKDPLQKSSIEVHPDSNTLYYI
jgi:hypothetical protein